MINKNQNKIVEIISKITRVDKNLIKDTSCMNDFVRWDSLAHLKIMMEIEKEFHKKVNTSKMSDLNSVNKILKFLEN